MCDVATAAMAVLGAYSAHSQSQQASKALDAQKTASDQATTQAKATAEAATKANDEATNRANPKAADLTAMSSSNALAAKGGASGTMLTGPQGVDPSTLLLGKTTLLGA